MCLITTKRNWRYSILKHAFDMEQCMLLCSYCTNWFLILGLLSSKMSLLFYLHDDVTSF